MRQLHPRGSCILIFLIGLISVSRFFYFFLYKSFRGKKMKTAHFFPLGSKEDTLNYFFILKYAIAYTVVEIK